MPVIGLVIVSHYNPRSKLLSRAHRLAEELEQPIYLWEAGSGEFAIPPPARWLRMGWDGATWLARPVMRTLDAGGQYGTQRLTKNDGPIC